MLASPTPPPRPPGSERLTPPSPRPDNRGACRPRCRSASARCSISPRPSGPSARSTSSSSSAAGGSRPVWLADERADRTTLRQAAIKLFAIDPRLGEQARQDIIAEAARLCRVEHPNIVRFYSLPVDEERGIVGLAMEYVGGESLAVRLRVEKRLAVAEAVDVGIAVASALVAVHEAGIVHRDIWPANVIEDRALRGSPAAYKLIDFGIAVPGAGEAGEAPPVGPDALGGKRGYVDPVCWRDASRPTPRSDLVRAGGAPLRLPDGQDPGGGGGPPGRGRALRREAPAARLRRPPRRAARAQRSGGRSALPGALAAAAIGRAGGRRAGAGARRLLRAGAGAAGGEGGAVPRARSLRARAPGRVLRAPHGGGRRAGGAAHARAPGAGRAERERQEQPGARGDPPRAGGGRARRGAAVGHGRALARRGSAGGAHGGARPHGRRRLDRGGGGGGAHRRVARGQPARAGAAGRPARGARHAGDHRREAPREPRLRHGSAGAPRRARAAGAPGDHHRAQRHAGPHPRAPPARPGAHPRHGAGLAAGHRGVEPGHRRRAGELRLLVRGSGAARRADDLPRRGGGRHAPRRVRPRRAVARARSGEEADHLGLLEEARRHRRRARPVRGGDPLPRRPRGRRRGQAQERPPGADHALGRARRAQPRRAAGRRPRLERARCACWRRRASWCARATG